MAREKTQFWESARMNNATYIEYYNRLMELSLAMFEWRNVPDEIDTRFLELILFSEGKAIFFRDEYLEEYLALQFTMSGPLDVYHIPINRRAFAVNGYQRELNSKDSVIIFNNMLHLPSKAQVETMARRLYNFDRTIDVNINAQKTPLLIICDDSQRLTMRNLYKSYDGNEPVIYGTKALNIDGLKTLKTDAPYVADRVYQLKADYWNEALTYLGISNTNVTKHERMNRDEVTRNLGGVFASRFSRLDERRRACEKINKMFGLDMWVDFREFDDADLDVPGYEEVREDGEVDNVEIYN